MLFHGLHIAVLHLPRGCRYFKDPPKKMALRSEPGQGTEEVPAQKAFG